MIQKGNRRLSALIVAEKIHLEIGKHSMHFNEGRIEK